MYFYYVGVSSLSTAKASTGLWNMISVEAVWMQVGKEFPDTEWGVSLLITKSRSNVGIVSATGQPPDKPEELTVFMTANIYWRRKWQPTPVFLPGESQGPGSLEGCRLWGHTELDTTEAT